MAIRSSRFIAGVQRPRTRAVPDTSAVKPTQRYTSADGLIRFVHRPNRTLALPPQPNEANLCYVPVGALPLTCLLNERCNCSSWDIETAWLPLTSVILDPARVDNSSAEESFKRGERNALSCFALNCKPIWTPNRLILHNIAF